MKRQLPFVYVAFGIIAFGALFLNNSGGKDGNYAGLAGDSGTCSSCHGGGTVNGSGLTLAGAPANYVAGQTYPLTLTLKDPDAAVGGFQIVATDGASATAIGTFVAAADVRLNNTKRIVQSSPKSFTSGSVSWTFNWTAPATGTAVKFNFAGVAANSSGGNSGDAVYSGSQSGPLTSIAGAKNAVAALKIFPNIIQKGGFITVETENNGAETRLQIVDLSGRVLKTVQKAANTEGSKISTLDLPTGRFFIRSTNGVFPEMNTFIVF